MRRAVGYAKHFDEPSFPKALLRTGSELATSTLHLLLDAELVDVLVVHAREPVHS